MPFTILTQTLLTSNSLGSPLHLQHLCYFELTEHNFHAFSKQLKLGFVCVYLRRLQGWCDGK